MSHLREQRGMIGVAALAVGLAALWLSNDTGTIRDDPKRHISIPDPLLVPLQVQAAYNQERIFFRYTWPSERPHIFHDMLRYEGGQWKRYGNAVPGSEPHGLHEDRVAMMVDDGRVPEFARYGGYYAIGDGLAEMTDAADGDEVQAHPYLGAVRKQEDVLKYLPATRSNPGDWRTTVAPERILAMREAGYFLDLWHWRAGRGNAIGFADDQTIYDTRDGDSGRSTWFTNWDGDKKQPRLMFDPDKAGHAALKWDDVIAGRVAQDSIHYLHPSTAVAFDPDRQWQEGDTLPRRALRDPDGSRADIVADGHWADGNWTVTLSRALDTGDPLNDKIFKDGGQYTVAFAIHRNATGGRWHYVSMPVSLGLGRDAELQAASFTGDAPVWTDNWKSVKLFYPGQVTWSQLNSERHAGRDRIKQGVPVRQHHSEGQLARYGVEMEFFDEIVFQWRLTLFAGLLLFAAIAFALTRAVRK